MANESSSWVWRDQLTTSPRPGGRGTTRTRTSLDTLSHASLSTLQVSVRLKMSSLALPQLKLPSAVKTKFWKKRSVTISDLDPQYRVTYLGNVLTGWAKGE